MASEGLHEHALTTGLDHSRRNTVFVSRSGAKLLKKRRWLTRAALVACIFLCAAGCQEAGAPTLIFYSPESPAVNGVEKSGHAVGRPGAADGDSERLASKESAYAQLMSALYEELGLHAERLGVTPQTHHTEGALNTLLSIDSLANQEANSRLYDPGDGTVASRKFGVGLAHYCSSYW